MELNLKNTRTRNLLLKSDLTSNKRKREWRLLEIKFNTLVGSFLYVNDTLIKSTFKKYISQGLWENKGWGGPFKTCVNVTK